jgi:hypothetical protein
MAAEQLKEQLAKIAKEAALREIARERLPNNGEEYAVISRRGLASLKGDPSIVECMEVDAINATDATA